MNNPGLTNLGDVALAAINAATTATVVTSQPDAQGVTQAYRDGLEGMIGATLQANFTYGSGGTSLKVKVETSLDQGVTWIEIVRIAFGTASKQRVLNLSSIVSRLAYEPAALGDDQQIDGIFGERMRASIITTGTYAGNTSLSLRLQAR